MAFSDTTSTIATQYDISNSSNWNTAYGWGDHSGLYETAFTLLPINDGGTNNNAAGYDTDRILYYDGTKIKSTSYTITHASNWQTAYGWGDHSGQGYLTSVTSSDMDSGLPDGTYTFIMQEQDTDADNQTDQYKSQSFTWTNGVLTSVGALSAWTNIPTS